ncbi:TKL family protein kinase [Tritrichomonas foetus]|uniref:TKL family protein kinase n=1 Tax=Tritrichomonas foetus TaxID=1144522 RepID=A0A1J4J509_9EUKA|nr:TKL family protein kinase [Tritrichomonas foetus]|eukprot:OHS92739.1 TKL family protein kinase [Tritrichomonas foetus]
MTKNPVVEKIPQLLRSYLVERKFFKIGDMIGSGDYGELFLAEHISSGLTVAIKKLYMEEIDGIVLLSFCRELEAYSRCNYIFILPFYGWSHIHPYLIITEYMSNGSLYDALHHKRKHYKVKLSPTDKTKIAIGIASGMHYLHENNVAHRDLKSLNVLLDDNLIPKISDFGLYRFRSQEHLHDGKAYSAQWMAPELHDPKTSKKANNKVDVYSYGIILWELLTGDIPFKDMSPVQIAHAVGKDEERPKIPSDAPKPLSNLIVQCWDKNPANRPSFDQILKVWLTKATYFPGTVSEDVDKLYSAIRHDQRSRGKDTPLPLSTEGIKKLLKKKKKHSKDSSSPSKILTEAFGSNKANETEFSSKRKKDLLEYPDLPEPISPHFLEKFNQCVAIVTIESAPIFFNLVTPLFTKAMPETTLIQVSSDLERVLYMDTKMVQIFVSLDGHTKLPLSMPVVASTSLRILLYIIKTYPSAVNNRLLEVLHPYIDRYSNHILIILSPFFEKFDQMSNSMDVADFLIKNANAFLVSAGTALIRTYNYLCEKSDNFRINRLEYLLKIAISAIEQNINNDNYNTIHQAYAFVIRFFNDSLIINPNVISFHLNQNELMHDALSYMIRQQRCVLTPDLMSGIIRCLPLVQIAPEAIYVLYLNLRNYPETKQMLISLRSQWTNQSVPFEYRMGLFMTLLSDPSIRYIVCQMPEFPQFLNEIVSMNDIGKIDLAGQIILKMQNGGQNCLQFYQALSECGFFGMYLGQVQQSQNVGIYRNAITIIDIISRLIFVPDFMPFIPFMVDYFIKSPNELTLNALSAIAVLSSVHATTRNILKNCQIDTALEIYKNDPNYAQYAILIAQSLNQ